jgi:hypothetical protein
MKFRSALCHHKEEFSHPNQNIFLGRVTENFTAARAYRLKGSGESFAARRTRKEEVVVEQQLFSRKASSTSVGILLFVDSGEKAKPSDFFPGRDSDLTEQFFV